MQMTKKLSFDEALEQITKEQFIDACYQYDYREICKHLNISEGVRAKLIKYWDIDIKKIQYEKRTQTILSNKHPIDFVKERITKDELIKYYIIDNHSHTDAENYFGISGSMLDEILRDYDIKKGYKLANVLSSKTKYEKYGSKEAYDAYMLEKIKQTAIDKYGSYEELNKLKGHAPNVTPESIQKGFRTKLERYGDIHYNNRDKAKETNLDRYGVENTANLDWVKEKVKATYKQTCLDRYGCESFLCSPNFKASYNSSESKPNRDFANLLESNSIAYEREFPIIRYRYDFKVGNTLIEIDPYPTHNSNWGIFDCDGLAKDYHFNKTKLASDNGYRCIHIFDWEDSNKIISLLKDRPTVYARKCTIMEVPIEQAKDFLDKYHLQGYAKDSSRYGLYLNDELISIMTFGKPRYNKKFEYELIRYCSIYNVVGGEERLFKHFIKAYNPTSIVSYCDNSKFKGIVYDKLGFTLGSYGTPSCHWYNPGADIHITDNFLRQRGFDQLFKTNYGKGTSNEELMIEHGFLKIYDCGQSRYEWHAREH